MYTIWWKQRGRTVKRPRCLDAAADFGVDLNVYDLVETEGGVFLWPAGRPDPGGGWVAAGLPFLGAAAAGTRPRHEAAYAQRLGRVYDVEREEDAVSYLSGRELAIDTPYKGWLALRYRGHPLGWGKAVRGRLKNHYPKAIRLRNS